MRYPANALFPILSEDLGDFLAKANIDPFQMPVHSLLSGGRIVVFQGLQDLEMFLTYLMSLVA